MSQKKATTGKNSGATRPNTPEPKDKLSDEWRAWKLRQFRRAFLRLGGEEYRRAWDEFRALLYALMADGDFWHVSHALALLPHLLTARQEIDRIHASEKRSRAGVKDAETRQRKAQTAREAK